MKIESKKPQASGRPAAWLAAAALFLSACGGGGGGGAEPAAPLAELVLSAQQAVLPSGSRQVQVLTLRNTGKAAAHQLQITVAADAKLLQLALSCKGEAAARCKSRSDGGLDIAELRAGETIELEQVLRLEPGYSGPAGAQWSLSHAAAPAPLGTRQILQAYAADVVVALAAPQASIKDGQATVLSYEVTLSNQGPDEARDVDWRLMPAAGMRWQAATCAASGGAQCPASLAEAMSVARLPKGGEIRLRAEYTSRMSTSGREPDFLRAQAQLAGDPRVGNNRAVFNPGADPWTGSLSALSLDGRAYDLSADWRVRIRGEGIEREEMAPADVTGVIWLTNNGKGQVGDISLGTFNGKTSLTLGSYDFGKGRQPFLAGERFVDDVVALNGQDFNILASRSEAGGRPAEGVAWAGRFEGAWFLLCRSSQPTPLAQCSAQDLRRYAVSVVGTEIELLYGTEMLRMRVLRTEKGHVLYLAMKDAVTQQEQVWLGLSAVALASGMQSQSGFGESSMRSSVGISEAIWLDTKPAPTGRLVLTGPYSEMPNSYLLYLQSSGRCPPYEVQGELAPSGLAGLFQGPVGLFSCGSKSIGGPVFHIQGAGLMVLLGATSGPLAGRWVITVPGSSF